MKNLKTLLLLIIFFAFNTNASEKISENKEILKNKKDQAIKGYDTVSYFQQEIPLKGTEEFSLEYKGATWLLPMKKI